MLKYVLSFLFFILSQIAFSQLIDSVAALPAEVFESSGLLFINGNLYTHNDSGTEAALYQIDTNTAQIIKTIYLKNELNIDWEDITQDSSNIYVGDFGNNQGNRTNLSILKLNKDNFLNSQNLDSITVEKIEFSYEDQTNFTAANQNTAYDAEALIAYEDSLYVFTKDWTTQTSSVYALPKTPGTFSAKKIDFFDVDGLITGATIHPSNSKITLCGYTKLLSSFIFEMKDFSSSAFFQANNMRYNISPIASTQIEGVCAIDEKKCYVSSEKFFTAQAYLHLWQDTTFVPVDSIQPIDTLQPVDSTMALFNLNNTIELFPNPSNNFLNLSVEFKKAEIFDLKGKKVSMQFKNPINIQMLEKGIYFLLLRNENNYLQSIQFEKQ